MLEINKQNSIDIQGVKWGFSPAPLLPRSLRTAWANDSLPGWLCTEIGIPLDSTLADLGSSVWKTVEIMSPRVRHFLLYLIRNRIKEVESYKCIDRSWPLGLKITDIGWAIRTKNCLKHEGLLGDVKRLENLTFADLLKMEGMGAVCILDYCSTLEGAMDIYDKLATEYAESCIADKPIDYLSVLEVAVNEEWPAQISRQDPRFASMLSSGSETLQERLEQLLADPDGINQIANVPLLVKSVTKARKLVDKLKEQTLEEGLLAFLRAILKADDFRLGVIAERLGWNGHKAATLEECGRRLGVTRERVRQIQSKVLKEIPKHEVFMPSLDRALVLLEERVPLTFEEASKVLVEENISCVNFYPESLLSASKLLGKKTTLEVCETKSEKLLVGGSSDKKLVQLIPLLGRKLAGQSGVTSVFNVKNVLELMGYNVGEEDLRRALSVNKNIQFLNDDWFWVPNIPIARNRLRNVARKILSVASPQSVSSIRGGVRKVYRWRSTSNRNFAHLTVAPLDVMKRFFEIHSDFKVINDEVYPRVPLEYSKELGETDRIMVDVIRSSPSGVLDRRGFAEGCLARGMNENTFNVYSTYSCVLDHVGVDIWKLRGVVVDPASVEALRIANHLKPREKRLLAYGWTEDGKLWMAVRVPRLGKNSIVVGCPGPVKRYLVGQEFVCKEKEGEHECGVVAINESGTSYGYGTFIRRFGLDENDILLAEFDLSENEVKLSVGDEDILYESS